VLDDLSNTRTLSGCARGLLGSVEGANLVKLHHDAPAVSYLTYPHFEKDPHPALAGSMIVHLRQRQLDGRDYRASSNPPILHRKETFVTADHPMRARFARLTAQEERAGLLEQTDTIGTRDGWAAALHAHSVRVSGHRLYPFDETRPLAGPGAALNFSRACRG
jgi:DNA phosphorothioation-associated putative methyltransferase